MTALPAKEWLRSAQDDLLLIEKIVSEEHLTHLVAFHAQQAVEKSIKAILEYYGRPTPKKHDLLHLKRLVEDVIEIGNEEMLDTLNELYVESRYPGELGLLPNGKPALEDGREFFEFAREIFRQVSDCVAGK